MTEKDFVHKYLELKVNGEMDFTQIKKELREVHQLSTPEISSIIDQIANLELRYEKGQGQKNIFSILLFLTIGLTAFAYSCYSIVYPTGNQTADLLGYACLFGGIYIIYRNIQRLRA